VKLASYLLLVSTLLAGCSYSGPNIRPYVSWTGLVPLQKTQRHSHWAIDANASVYVASPMGLDDDELIREMTTVFQRYYPRARQSQFRESIDQAFVSARYAGMEYVVYPRVVELTDQQGLGKVVREEITVQEFERGEAELEILIFASQGEQLVDHLKLDTRGSIFTVDSRKLIWPPLEAYLKSVSQFSLAQR
jgi:hypothetical protein